MADKLTQHITDALAKAAADPAGLPLYAGKAEPGLFPNASAAKPAAQKCLADGLLRVVGTDTRSKTPRELYGLTEKGWEVLLAQVNPKQVLEDFVRVLEARRGEVGELLDTARRMADGLQGLKDAVTRVLPAVTAARVESPLSRDAERSGDGVALRSASRLHGETVAVLDAPPQVDLAPAILARLADWTGPTDCPLPDLYRSLADAPTIGQFHDCLRKLVADGAISLPSWTGPLYALPEPAFALLVGHGIAYYAAMKCKR